MELTNVTAFESVVEYLLKTKSSGKYN